MYKKILIGIAAFFVFTLIVIIGVRVSRHGDTNVDAVAAANAKSETFKWCQERAISDADNWRDAGSECATSYAAMHPSTLPENEPQATSDDDYTRNDAADEAMKRQDLDARGDSPREAGGADDNAGDNGNQGYEASSDPQLPVVVRGGDGGSAA